MGAEEGGGSAAGRGEGEVGGGVGFCVGEGLHCCCSAKMGILDVNVKENGGRRGRYDDDKEDEADVNITERKKRVLYPHSARLLIYLFIYYKIYNLINFNFIIF